MGSSQRHGDETGQNHEYLFLFMVMKGDVSVGAHPLLPDGCRRGATALPHQDARLDARDLVDRQSVMWQDWHGYSLWRLWKLWNGRFW